MYVPVRDTGGEVGGEVGVERNTEPSAGMPGVK